MIIYTYIAVGVLVIAASYISYDRKDKDIADTVHDKLHEFRNDGSHSFKSANIIGYLLAFIFSALFCPLLAIKKLLKF